jgi:hypothetical protein
MSKVIKLTEADLRKIISEQLESETNEQGVIKSLISRGVSALQSRGAKSVEKSVIKGVLSTMRRDVAELLAKVPVIKISPKTIKALDEPRYNVRVAYENIEELAKVGTTVRSEYSGIESALANVRFELMKPTGSQLNIKEVMEGLYKVKDEITQDLIKRPSLQKDVQKLQVPLNKVNASITHIENLFKTPEKPTSYLVK